MATEAVAAAAATGSNVATPTRVLSSAFRASVDSFNQLLRRVDVPQARMITASRITRVRSGSDIAIWSSGVSGVTWALPYEATPSVGRARKRDAMVHECGLSDVEGCLELKSSK
jgi:hypothetical protein